MLVLLTYMQDTQSQYCVLGISFINTLSGAIISIDTNLQNISRIDILNHPSTVPSETDTSDR